MKKLFLAVFALTAAGGAAKAQMPYTFSVQTGQAYTPLTSGASMNGTTIWDDQRFSVKLPFAYRIGLVATDSFNLDLALGGFYTSFATIGNSFGYDSFVDYADRGTLDHVSSKSPIRYLVSGSAPNRIFKAEIANAGFAKEIKNYGTANDSINLQIWLYEGSGITELRYGPHKISHYGEYFYFDGPIVGYVKNSNPLLGSFDIAYNLSGNPSNPTIDSVTSALATINTLTAYPTDGTVYRYTPVPPLGFANGSLAGAALQVFPTMAREVLTLTYSSELQADYRVVSLAGATMLQGQLGKGTSKLDIAGLAAGSYVVEVQNATGKAARRFSKL